MENCKTIFLWQNEKITLTENKEIVSSDKNTGKILKTFFSNVVASLNIPGFDKCNPVAGNTDDPINKSIVKYRKKNTGEILNTFFSNIVASLNICGYDKCNPVAGM